MEMRSYSLHGRTPGSERAQRQSYCKDTESHSKRQIPRPDEIRSTKFAMRTVWNNIKAIFSQTETRERAGLFK